MVPFDALGFHFLNEDEFVDTLGLLVDEGQRRSCRSGFYVCWEREGIELWYGFHDESRFGGSITPFFYTEGQPISFRVTAVHEDPEYPFDGFLVGDVNALIDVKGVRSGDYPMCVQMVDFRCALDRLEQSGLLSIRTVAFAGDLVLFEGLEELRRYTKGIDPVLAEIAPRTFLPVGLFPDPEEESSAPQPVALLTGYLRRIHPRRNPLTGHPFYHMIVDTQGQRLDVLSADPALAEARPNQLLFCTAWMAARMRHEP